MKLDTKEVIEGLKDINRRLGFEYKAINSAIKVCKMWDSIKGQCGNVFVEFCPESKEPLVKLCTDIEERFFSSVIKQTVTIEVQGKDEESLRDAIQQVRLLYGVKDVRPHDSRY